MSATFAYEDALVEMDDTAEVGLKSAVEALRDGEDEIAAALLRQTAECLEDSE